MTYDMIYLTATG